MPLTPADTHKILNSIGHQPNKKLGQNFLIDGNIVNKSIAFNNLTPHSTVVEIGPGLGTLSQAILNTGAQLHAIEKDPHLHKHLEQSISHPNFHLTLGDALDSPLASFQPTPNSTPFHIIANLPYAISTPWMDAVLEGPLPASMTLMLQKEAADRFSAQPGNKSFGAISIFLNSAFQKTASHKVSRRCFYPIPGVDSTLLHVELKPSPFLFNKPTKDLIRFTFTQRRKQISSILKNKAPLWLDWLTSQNIPPSARPETIPTPAWQKLNELHPPTQTP